MNVFVDKADLDPDLQDSLTDKQEDSSGQELDGDGSEDQPKEEIINAGAESEHELTYSGAKLELNFVDADYLWSVLKVADDKRESLK